MTGYIEVLTRATVSPIVLHKKQPIARLATVTVAAYPPRMEA